MNGCGKCVDAHEKIVREKGASEDLVAGIIRVASVIQALSAVVDMPAQANPSARLAGAVLVSA
jgi:lipoyl-dependent peroxiredoxin subunit D